MINKKDMLNWGVIESNSRKLLHTKLANLEIVCYSEYRTFPFHFQVLLDSLHVFNSKGFKSLEEAQIGAEQWVKEFFSPLLLSAREHFLNTLEAEWSVEEILKHFSNDQQKRHTGSDIRRTDIREVLESEMKREEEV